MPNWKGSRRRSQLPPNWQSIRRRILQRDNHRCTQVVNGQRCPNPATDVHHIGPGDDHDPSNLTSLCQQHHRHTTGVEGHAALQAMTPPRKRAPEPHPGLITPHPPGQGPPQAHR